MAAVKPTKLEPENSTLPLFQNRADIPHVVAIIAQLIEGDITAEAAARELQTLSAPGWLIRSLPEIEKQFADPDPDSWFGPCDAIVRKIGGDA